MRRILLALVIFIAVWKFSIMPIHAYVPDAISSRLISFIGMPMTTSDAMAVIMPPATPAIMSPPAAPAVLQPPPISVPAASACPALGKCEDLTTDAQCGVCPSACEWMSNACRSRELTAAEQKSP